MTEIQACRLGHQGASRRKDESGTRQPFQKAGLTPQSTDKAAAYCVAWTIFYWWGQSAQSRKAWPRPPSGQHMQWALCQRRTSPASVVILDTYQSCSEAALQALRRQGVLHNVFSNGCLLGPRLLGRGSSAALGTEILTTGFSFKVCSSIMG